jgi:hypothetical protein
VSTRIEACVDTRLHLGVLHLRGLRHWSIASGHHRSSAAARARSPPMSPDERREEKRNRGTGGPRYETAGIEGATCKFSPLPVIPLGPTSRRGTGQTWSELIRTSRAAKL